MSHKAKELKDVLTNGEVCISNVFRTILWQECLRKQGKCVFFKIIQKSPEHRLKSWNSVVRYIPLINNLRSREDQEVDTKKTTGMEEELGMTYMRKLHQYSYACGLIY
jgi:alpha-D-ribose 1-methylphosphonate 5-phosphate C-P lyase